MITRDPELTNLIQMFPFLKDAGKELREQMVKHFTIVKVPKGNCLFLEGDECSSFPLILAGSIRVYKLGESGKEITLYRLAPGDGCIMTASCILSRTGFPAIATVEEPLDAAVVPSPVFREWMGRYDVWRNYVFGLVSNNLTAIMATLEEVAFQRMDIRIAEFILKLAGKSDNGIKITHQDIALELGTSREVVSRILKHFESAKLVSLKRGAIILTDLDKFRQKTLQEKF
jgi:CRP/FNR family transcriptional regulator